MNEGIFDAEPLLAFAFDEPGTDTIKHALNGVYDGETDGYVTTINLGEFRYIATRLTPVGNVNSHITALREMGIVEYTIDELWKPTSGLKAAYSPLLGDAYAVAAAKEFNSGDDQNITLLVDADDDYDAFEEIGDSST